MTKDSSVTEPQPVANRQRLPIQVRLAVAGFAFLTLFGFAFQAASYQANPHSTGSLLVPILLLGATTTALISACGFADRPWLAGLLGAVGTGLFVWGESYADVGLNVLFGGPLPWWSEKVAVMTLLFGIPLILLAALGAFVIARVLAARMTA